MAVGGSKGRLSVFSCLVQVCLDTLTSAVLDVDDIGEGGLVRRQYQGGGELVGMKAWHPLQCTHISVISSLAQGDKLRDGRGVVWSGENLRLLASCGRLRLRLASRHFLGRLRRRRGVVVVVAAPVPSGAPTGTHSAPCLCCQIGALRACECLGRGRRPLADDPSPFGCW